MTSHRKVAFFSLLSKIYGDLVWLRRYLAEKMFQSQSFFQNSSVFWPKFGRVPNSNVLFVADSTLKLPNVPFLSKQIVEPQLAFNFGVS